MYVLINELSYDYSEYSGFVGDAGKIEFECSGLPGLAQPIAHLFDQWTREHNLTTVTFGIYQDTDPFFDQYKVYMVFHDSSIVWTAIVPLIPLILKALAALGVSFIIWRMSTVIFAPPAPAMDAETVKAIAPIIENILASDLAPEQKSTIITALLKGTGEPVQSDPMKWLAIGAVAIGGVMLFKDWQRSKT